MNSRRKFLSDNIETIKKMYKESGTHRLINSLFFEPALEKENDSPAVNLNPLFSDFTEDSLRVEMMRLGKDPACLSKNDMLDIISSEMNENYSKESAQN